MSIEESNETSFNDFVSKLKSSKEFLELLAELCPLVERIKNDKKALEILKPCSKEIINRSEKIGSRAQLLKKGLKQKAVDETDTLQKALMYLGYFEMAITTLLDNILMIYIANHHDLYVLHNSCYANNFHALDFVFLKDKIDFLKHHDLDICPKEFKKIRDKIAHMDFEIKPNGIIIVEEKTYDITKQIIYFSALVLMLEHALIDSGFIKLVKDLDCNAEKDV